MLKCVGSEASPLFHPMNLVNAWAKLLTTATLLGLETSDLRLLLSLKAPDEINGVRLTITLETSDLSHGVAH